MKITFERKREHFFKIVREIYNHYSLILRTNTSTPSLYNFYGQFLSPPYQVGLQHINEFLMFAQLIGMNGGKVISVISEFPQKGDLSRKYILFLKTNGISSLPNLSSILVGDGPGQFEVIDKKTEQSLQPLGYFFVSPGNRCLTPEDFSSAYQENYKFDIKKWPIKEVIDAIKKLHQLYNSEEQNSLTVRRIFEFAGLRRFHSNPEEARFIVYYFNLQLQNLGLVVSGIDRLRSIATDNKTPPSDEAIEILLKKLLKPTLDSGSENSVEAECVSALAAPSKMSISYLVHPYNCMAPSFNNFSADDNIGEQAHVHCSFMK